MKDIPLTVKVTKEALTIEIGNEINAFAFEESDWNNPWVVEKQDFIRTFKITDPLGFAVDMRRAMLDEREDGSTPLSDFLDKMAIAAVEDGSESVEYPE
jgi:hypothetical protein